MKYSTKTLIGLIVLVVFSAPAVNAIKLSVSSDDVSVSSDYDLADSTTLHEETMIMNSGVAVSRQASGSDSNKLEQHISGSDYKVDNAFSTMGTFSSSTSTIAAEDAAVVSQDLSADGDAIVALYGASGTEEASQYAGAEDASIESSQSLLVGGAVLAGQNTAISGVNGMMGSSAVSDENNFEVSSGFSGVGGSLDAQLISVASEGTNMYGTATVSGIECLNDNILRFLSSGEYSMSVDGLYAAGDGDIGTFGLSAAKKNSKVEASPATSTSSAQLTNLGSHPEIVATPPGKSTSFALSSYKIDQSKPLQLYLKTDSNFLAEKLDPTAANQAIALAASTWDYYTQPGTNNLFQPTVINDPNVAADTVDGLSVHAFMPISSSYIAYTRTYWDSNGNVIESDVTYNTKSTWTTDWTTAKNKKATDLQSIALHELGHSCGLKDLYGLPSGDARKGDLSQTMNYANSKNYPRHYLGAGDIKGIQTKYGA